MPLITHAMIHTAYRLAKEVYEGRLAQKDAIASLVAHQMNNNSAGDYLHNYVCMVEGRRFPRTLNAYGSDYFLQKMLEDGGRARLLDALSALRQHIDYYEGIQNVTLRKQREIFEHYRAIAQTDVVESYPDEVTMVDTDLLEGKTRTVSVNVYERNPIARQQCIEHYGYKCFACNFDFEEVYGEIGRAFIHVHHLVEISSVGEQYSINPIEDLRPLCPNCHAMIHRRRPAYSIDELKNHLTNR